MTFRKVRRYIAKLIAPRQPWAARKSAPDRDEWDGRVNHAAVQRYQINAPGFVALGVSRSGRVMSINYEHGSEYDAMEHYDHVCKMLSGGNVNLHIVLQGNQRAVRADQ